MTDIVSIKDKVNEEIRAKTAEDRQGVYDDFNRVHFMRGFERHMGDVFRRVAKHLGFEVEDFPPTIVTKVIPPDVFAFYSALFLIQFSVAGHSKIFRVRNEAQPMIAIQAVPGDGEPTSSHEVMAASQLVELLGGERGENWPHMNMLLGKLWNYFIDKGWEPVLRKVEMDDERNLPSFVEIHFKGGLHTAIMHIHPLVAEHDAMEYDKRLIEYNEALERRENNDGQ